MNTKRRYYIAGLTLVALILYVLRPTTTDNAHRKGGPARQWGFHRPAPLVNATLMMLARNTDLDGVLASMRDLENKFNKHYHYPWVFLNEVPFADDFIANVTEAASSPVSFGLVPPEHWFMPEWIDKERVDREMDQLASIPNIPYAKNIPYRNMCRFNSGFFYHHPLLQKYKYYWRVEPRVQFRCNIDFDPFAFMQEHNKTYAFVIAIKEIKETVQTLWDTTKEFMRLHPEHLPAKSNIDFVRHQRSGNYNLCHFWSNFEIADMDFWRGPAYSAYFEHLDKAGGFYYERWGDAPVHTIGASILLPSSAFHFFDRIGYTHQPFTHCPRRHEDRRDGMCDCGARDSVDDNAFFSCMPRHLKIMSRLSGDLGWRDGDTEDQWKYDGRWEG